MTCKEVMTANPVFCVPEDRAIKAAELMKRENVGPIPVVLSSSEPRVIGIVTDRDLIVRVVADGRAPEAVSLSEIMTANPVTCREEQDVHEAMANMSRQQVRRIPVVDSEDRLCGIVAQADIARRLDDREAGEVLEDISQPGRNTVGRAFRRAGRAAQGGNGAESGAGLFVAASIGALLGAGLMALAGKSGSAGRFSRRPELIAARIEADEVAGGSPYA